MGREAEPVLVIMAAGMGSRFGGLKQLEPIDEENHILMDYSIYDALSAGFQQILVIIRRDFEQGFRETIGRQIEKKAAVKYAFQELDALPEGCSVPKGRQKPWGTAHALWCCRDVLRNMSFVTVNADDYYGEEAYRLAYRFLKNPTGQNEHALIGYDLKGTLSPNGTVSRGVCVTDAEGRLIRIDERKRVRLSNRGCEYASGDGNEWARIPDGALASMNLWAFRSGFLEELGAGFEGRLERGVRDKPLGFEETLTESVQDMLDRDACKVRVLPTKGKWIGMTYREDKVEVVRSINKMVKAGWYRIAF